MTSDAESYFIIFNRTWLLCWFCLFHINHTSHQPQIRK